MIPLPSDIAPRDVEQWFRGGVCVYNGTPHRFHDSEGDGIYIQSLTLGGLDEHFRVDWDDRDSLYAHWPACGSLNVGRVAIYLNRTQVQGYRRTYNADCLEVIMPGKWSAMRALGPDVGRLNPNSARVIISAFNTNYPSFDRAVEELAEDRIYSRAISPHIILAGNDEVQEVYYRGRRAGTIANGVFTAGGLIIDSNRVFKLLQGRVIV